MSIPSDLYYTKSHQWIRNEGSDLRIGITEFGQDDLGKIAFVELPEIGATIEAGEPFGNLESEKSVSELYAPVSGTVVEVNPSLESNPELINESPYQQAWLIVIEASDEDELDSLLSAEEYKEHIE